MRSMARASSIYPVLDATLVKTPVEETGLDNLSDSLAGLWKHTKYARAHASNSGD